MADLKSLLWLRGVRASYLKPLSKKSALVIHGQVIKSDLSSDFDYDPFSKDKFQTYGGGVALRAYVSGNSVLSGFYLSGGYEFQHFDWSEEVFVGDFGSVRKVTKNSHADLHNLELIMGVSGTLSGFFFDFGIRQGMRFSFNQWETNMDIFIFRRGMYTMPTIGVGARF